MQTRRSEVKVAVSMAERNRPFARADHFSPLLKEYFKDSPTAQSNQNPNVWLSGSDLPVINASKICDKYLQHEICPQLNDVS